MQLTILKLGVLQLLLDDGCHAFAVAAQPMSADAPACITRGIERCWKSSQPEL